MYKRIKNNETRENGEIKNANSVVTFNYYGRVNYTPCVSPFDIKLETYLRAAKVPYETKISFEKSSKGKTPWVTFSNDEPVADSFFIIERLKSMGYDLDAHLTPDQWAIATAFTRMIEEATMMCGICYRYQYDINNDIFYQEVRAVTPNFNIFTRFLIYIFKKKYALMVWLQGTGKHSYEEVNTLAIRDMKAISLYLGTKRFMMGDRVTSLDCSLYGVMSLLLYHLPSSAPAKYVNENLHNITTFMDTMRALCWPDYREIIKSPDEFSRRFKLKI